MEKTLIPFAKNLRNNSTDAERILWSYLRRKQVHGLKFRRQTPIGPYIADFVCFPRKMIVELDGGQHAQEEHRAYDHTRDEWFKNQGFTVLRFGNNNIFSNLEGVGEEIMRHCLYPSPNPSHLSAMSSRPNGKGRGNCKGIPPTRGGGIKRNMQTNRFNKFTFLTIFFILNSLFFIPAAHAIIGPERGSGATTDYTPPALISAVALSSDGAKVVITWKDPRDADFHRVEVLRNDGTATPVTGVVRGRVQAGVQRYEDLDVIAGQTYLYQFKVMDLDFNTVTTTEYSVTVAPPPLTPPTEGGESASIPSPLDGGGQEGVTSAPAPQPSPTAGEGAVVVRAEVRTPEVGGTSEVLRTGEFAYGFSRARALSTEQELARAVAKYLDSALPGVFNRLFHQKTVTSKAWWYTYVNAYTYGGYTLDEIKQSVRFGGKTVHPTIPATAWRGSPDYKEFINK